MTKGIIFIRETMAETNICTNYKKRAQRHNIYLKFTISVVLKLCVQVTVPAFEDDPQIFQDFQVFRFLECKERAGSSQIMCFFSSLFRPGNTKYCAAVNI